jgi:hypothetical protein
LESLYRGLSAIQKGHVAIREPLKPGQKPPFANDGTDARLGFTLPPDKYAAWLNASAQRFESIAGAVDRVRGLGAAHLARYQPAAKN